MINQFVNNIKNMGFLNIFLYAFVLLMTHQSIAFLLANVEKYHKVEVKFYPYDIPIAMLFIFLFIYGIYVYKA